MSNWFSDLLFNSSIAHSILLFAIVITCGIFLGKVKIKGVSLGITWILFIGIALSHFGLIVDPTTLHFVKEFGLILFVYSIGLQVGPSFFSSFRKGGMRMNRRAVEMVLLNILVAIGAFYLFFDQYDSNSFPMLVGVLSGAVPNTPGLGAAEEALRQMGKGGVDIATGYACAYPLAVVGVIMVPMIVKAICKIKEDKENEQLTSMEEQDNSTKPSRQYIEMQNPSLDGKTILELRRILNREFICSRILHEGDVASPHKDTVVHLGDQLCVVSSEEDAEAIRTILGVIVDVDWDKIVTTNPLVSRRIVITKSKVNGKTLGQLHLGSIDDVTITRIVRSGTELFASSSLVLQVGDRMTVVGQADKVAAIASRVGNELDRKSTRLN